MVVPDLFCARPFLFLECILFLLFAEEASSTCGDGFALCLPREQCTLVYALTT